MKWSRTGGFELGFEEALSSSYGGLRGESSRTGDPAAHVAELGREHSEVDGGGGSEEGGWSGNVEEVRQIWKVDVEDCLLMDRPMDNIVALCSGTNCLHSCLCEILNKYNNASV